MSASQIYIVIGVISLAIIAVLLIYANKHERGKKLTPLAGLAFAFVIAGILFGENRLVGYGLMGIGVILALIDIFRNLKKR